MSFFRVLSGVSVSLKEPRILPRPSNGSKAGGISLSFRPNSIRLLSKRASFLLETSLTWVLRGGANSQRSVGFCSGQPGSHDITGRRRSSACWRGATGATSSGKMILQMIFTHGNAQVIH